MGTGLTMQSISYSKMRRSVVETFFSRQDGYVRLEQSFLNSYEVHDADDDDDEKKPSDASSRELARLERNQRIAA